MKIKSNVRAGSNSKRKGGGTDNPPGSEDPVVVPPVSRCAGV